MERCGRSPPPALTLGDGCGGQVLKFVCKEVFVSQRGVGRGVNKVAGGYAWTAEFSYNPRPKEHDSHGGNAVCCTAISGGEARGPVWGSDGGRSVDRVVRDAWRSGHQRTDGPGGRS